MKKLFTFKDSWPWVLILLFVSIVTFFAFRANWNDPTTHTKLDILGVVDLVFLALIAYHYELRERFVKLWNGSYHTSTNTAIIIQGFGNNIKAFNALCNMGFPNEIYKAIDAKVTECIDYWAKWNNSNASGGDVKVVIDRLKELKALNGATITVADEPINVNFIGKVMGYQEGQQLTVVFDGDRVKDLPQLLDLTAHEVSHLCLTALGVDPGYKGDNHHAIYKQTGFCG